MTEITLESPVQLGDRQVTALYIKEIRYVGMAAAFTAALKLVTEGQNYEASMKIARLQRQVVANVGGAQTALSTREILSMPLKLFRQVDAALDGKAYPVGTVVGEGDGVTTPVIFKLGTPLMLGGITGKESSPAGQITELTFIAECLGDVLPVVSANYEMEQVIALVEKLAQPIGTDVTLLRLPSWAMEQLTWEDGNAISKAVLPSFL
jgi:phage FluMu protein gp41